MQSVSSAFTAEERDSTRSIAASLLVSWKKETNLNNRTFTIGVSTIGGSHAIGINPGAVGGPGIYNYFDESDYLLSLAWERGLNMPIGGLATALAEARLDNTSRRFTPGYMGGQSELFTSILPRRPIIINAGFDLDGISQTIPQFAGIVTRQPRLDTRDRSLSLEAADYVDFFQNRFLDQEVMFTGKRTDEVMETMLRDSMGLATSQYELDYGINVIPFGLFEKGTRFSNIFNELAQAEYGHFYQDEEGKFRFENRQHWDGSPHSDVQRIVLTGQVIEAEAPTDDHLINVVEIRSPLRAKQPMQTVFQLPVLTSIEVPANSSVERFFEFDDPVLALTDPTSGGANSYFFANSSDDETGSDLSSSVTVQNLGTFARAVKYRLTNAGAQTAFITQLVIAGRVAKTVGNLYYRDRDSSSVTAYEERLLEIDNPYVQDESWARSFSTMILRDFSEPESVQRITIRAIPELQLGDLISWQGRYWRVFDIKTELNAAAGFIQRLTLLQRQIVTYFRIGISTIGGSDQIAP